MILEASLTANEIRPLGWSLTPVVLAVALLAERRRTNRPRTLLSLDQKADFLINYDSSIIVTPQCHKETQVRRTLIA